MPKNCSVCEHIEHREVPNEAQWDTPTMLGWAFLCEDHFDDYSKWSREAATKIA